MNHHKTTKLIYIAGYGRSGSTLLGLLLNTVEGGVHIGEADYLYRTDDSKFPEFWKNLKQEVLKEVDHKKVAQTKVSHIFRYFLKRKKSQQVFKELWGPSLNKISQAYDSPIIIDSSKSTYGAFARPLYIKDLGIQVKVIQLIRNPHGVMKSYIKGRNLSDTRQLAPAKKWGKPRALLNWFFTNMTTSLVYSKNLGPNELYTLQYESLTKNYEEEIHKLFTFLEIPLPQNLLDEEIKLCEDISFSGNRLRLKKSIVITPNEQEEVKGFWGMLATLLQKTFKSLKS